jgi:RNA polymerase sigma factor for flagellar operon FliA
MSGSVDVAVWRDLSRGSRDARDRVIEAYLPFARRQAKAVYRRTGNVLMDWDDYVQSATEGLIEAVDRFDVGMGLAFEAFAGIRVRGAVFNALRSICDRGDGLGNAPTAQRWRERARILAESEAGVDGLDAFIHVVVGLGVGFLLEHEAGEGDGADPTYVVERFQRHRALHVALGRLPQRERLILHLHYMNHIPFQDIAVMFALTRGRVSQLHHQALRRLRDRLRPMANDLPSSSPSTSPTLGP